MIDHELISDCRDLNLRYPEDLIIRMAEQEPLRPGQQTAAIYLNQAIETFESLDLELRDLAADCFQVPFNGRLRELPPTVPELDTALTLLAGDCSDLMLKHDWLGLALRLMDQVVSASLSLVEFYDHPEQIPMLSPKQRRLTRAQAAWLEEREVSEEDARRIEAIGRWFQMAVWANACADIDGELMVSALTRKGLIFHCVDPAAGADRLLLRLGANEMLMLLQCRLQLSQLPPSPEGMLWFDDLEELRRDLDLWREAPRQRVPHQQVTNAGGRTLQAGRYLFLLNSSVRLRRYLPVSAYSAQVLIGTPWGMVLGLVVVVTGADGLSEVELHLPLLEKRAGFLTDLTAIRVSSGLQSVLQQALNDPVHASASA